MPISPPSSLPTLALAPFHARRSALIPKMSVPVIVFAGLLAIAVCGAVETRSSFGVADELKIMNHENVVGPLPLDLFQQCKRGRKDSSARCHEKSYDGTESASTQSVSIEN